jgi:hypothetical protein
VQVSFDSPEYTADVDALGALRLLEAIRILDLEDHTRFYQASTSELYGKVAETPQSETTPFYPRRPYAEDEVSLLDILLVIARHKQLILRTVLVFTVLGIAYALVASEDYTSTAKVVREAQEDMPSGLSGGLSALRGFGINIGGASSGLTPQAYADIPSRREVRLAVVRDTFYFDDEDTTTTFVDYVDRPPGLIGTVLKYTIGLPGTLMEALQGERGTTACGSPVRGAYLPDRGRRESDQSRGMAGLIHHRSTNGPYECIGYRR